MQCLKFSRTFFIKISDSWRWNCSSTVVDYCNVVPGIRGRTWNSWYLEFVEETRNALRKVETNESTIILVNFKFNARVGNDVGIWNGRV